MADPISTFINSGCAFCGNDHSLNKIYLLKPLIGSNFCEFICSECYDDKETRELLKGLLLRVKPKQKGQNIA